MCEIGHIYFISNTVTENIKIGRAVNVEKRMANLQTATDCQLELLYSFPVHDPAAAEKELHEKFSAYLVRGEWYRFEGDVRRYVEALLDRQEAAKASLTRGREGRARKKIADSSRRHKEPLPWWFEARFGKK